jgi:cyclophilin family peptidyl-prolyl cis-trans isomerase/HEAT repeat protein
MQRLRDADVATYAAVLRAADGRMLDTAALDAALRSPELALRVAGVRALAQLAPTHRADAIPKLRALLDARDGDVVAFAAFGLGLAHDTASVARLASAVHATRDTTVARAAAWSLGEIGPSAATGIDSLLADPALPLTARRYVLLAASRIRPIPTARVAPFLAADDADVRWAAAYALARPHRAGGARALLALQNEPAPVRAEIARGLTLSAVGDSLRAPALARLTTLAVDRDPVVRIMAVRALGTFGGDARATLVSAFRDSDAQVRVAAAQSVAHVFPDDSLAWSSAWQADTSYRYRRSLIESAAASRAPLLESVLWLHASDWRLRAAAVSAFATARDTARALGIALDASHDVDPRVRGAAYGTLAALDSAARDPRVRSAFDAARTEPDTIARNAIPGVRDIAPARVPPVQSLAWYERVVRAVVVPGVAGHGARAVIRTERGPITVSLYGAVTPLTVWNFATLARGGFYDGLRFHRVVPAFVTQDGDPRGDGEGGPPYTIRDELTPLPYARGAMGMALSGPDTGGSQYFLTLTPQPHLDGHYTVFGMVVGGAQAMGSLREGDLIRTISIRNFDPR